MDELPRGDISRMRDRTREFQAAVESARQRLPALAPVRADALPVSEFTAAARRIDAALGGLRAQLDALRAVLSGGPGAVDETDVSRRAAAAKTEVGALQTQIGALDGLRDTLGRAPGGAAGGYGLLGGPRLTSSGEAHAQQVVLLLRARLADAGASLGAVLEAHAAAVRQRQERREVFSAAPLPAQRPGGNAWSPNAAVTARRGMAPDAGPAHTAIDMGGFAGGDQLQQLLSRGEAEGAQAEAQSAAMQGIERTISELGSLYTRIAALVAEQGEGVRRIDVNIADMQMNVARGRNELRRYLRRMSSNRALMVRIFVAVVLFLVFVRVFF